MGKKRKSGLSQPGRVTLREVAEHVSLAAGTVSALLNNAPSSRAIPEHTQQRIQAAALELNYRPNFLARSLRKKRTYTVGLIIEEIGDAYGSLVISGIEAYLRQHNYFFLTVIHRHDASMLREYSHLLLERGVEGFITVDTSLQEALPLPTVSVAGHRTLKGVTNIVLDQERGARVALEHLLALGHRKIAFMKAQPFSSHSEDRGRGIGAIRAIQEEALRVPQDVSVVGFDDIQWAAFHTPSLTTVRQPLGKMGQIAAETLIRMIEDHGESSSEIAIAPTLVVRESTGQARK